MSITHSACGCFIDSMGCRHPCVTHLAIGEQQGDLPPIAAEISRLRMQLEATHARALQAERARDEAKRVFDTFDGVLIPCELTLAEEATLVKSQLAKAYADIHAAEAARDEARAERDALKVFAGIGTWHDECRPNREMAARELAKSQAVIDKLADTISALHASHQALIAALTEPPTWHREPLHERVERECWKQHPDDFNACEHPACLLLKRIAVALGWTVTMNGVTPSTTAGETPTR